MDHSDSDEPPGRSSYVARAALDSVVLQQFADLLARRPPKRPPIFDATNSLTGATPLHCASHHGHASIVKLLLQVGADVNRAMSDGRTPMWFASSYCHADVVRVINDWAAGLD